MIKNTGKTVIVTGASGFIGGAICIELKKRGHTVIGVDLVHRKHLDPYMDYFFRQDFEDIPKMHSPIFSDADALIHCAGSSEVSFSYDDPSYYYKNNVAKTINLLHWVADNPGMHFMFSSSCSIYKWKSTPLIEEDTKSPLSPYAKTKWMVEQIIEDFNQAYKLKSTVFRYFNACGAIGNIHGQPMGKSHIFPQIYERGNHPFKVYGLSYKTPDRSCIRDYLHISDIAEAHIKAMENSVTGTYNIGSGVGFSVLEILKAAKVEKYIIAEKRPGDADSLVADNSFAKQMLGWTPLLTLNNIIQDLDLWYQSPNLRSAV